MAVLRGGLPQMQLVASQTVHRPPAQLSHRFVSSVHDQKLGIACICITCFSQHKQCIFVHVLSSYLTILTDHSNFADSLEAESRRHHLL